jgi:hypothetical protein
MTACQCSPCGQHFTGTTALDRHQDVDYSRHPAVACLDPGTLGMELNAHGRWGFPADADSHAYWRARTAERALAHTSPPGVQGPQG